MEVNKKVIEAEKKKKILKELGEAEKSQYLGNLKIAYWKNSRRLLSLTS